MKFLDTSTLAFASFAPYPPCGYAIFSHADSRPSANLVICGQDADRPPSGDATGEPWPGRRAAQACARARARGIRYLWAHSLCVDQSSSAEVAESVTTSFRLIWNADLCIVDLSDLAPATAHGSEIALHGLEKALASCRWFTRAWTLQELVAAKHVEFYDHDGNLRAAKVPLLPREELEMLSRVSGVDALVLADREALFDVSLGRRMSWAVHRQASLPEDIAYALVGICGIGGHLAPNYGEGRHLAFIRLQTKILETTTDLSILAWKRQLDEGRGEGGDEGETQQETQLQQRFSGILANSPADFRHFAFRQASHAPFASDSELSFNNRGLCVYGLLSGVRHRPRAGREAVLVLNASWRSRPETVHIGVTLKEIEPGLFVRANPHGIVCLPLRKEDVSPDRICVRLDISAREEKSLYMGQKESRVAAWMDDVSYSDASSPASSPRMQEQMPAKQDTVAANNTTETIQYTAQELPLHGKRLSKRGADEMQESDGHSSDDSSEDDVLLFDSLPEKPEHLQNSHPFQSVLPSLVSVGLAAWNCENELKKDTCDVHTRAKKEPMPVTSTRRTELSLVPSVGSTIGNISIPFRPAKRARRDSWSQQSTGSWTAETDREELDLFVVRYKHDTYQDMLACPFYRLDPVRHHSCMWEMELPDIRSLKQHIIVDHHRPERCPICHAVFDNAVDRDQHIIARSCNKREAPADLLVGVSEDQIEKLSQRDDGTEWRQNAESRHRKRGTKNSKTKTRPKFPKAASDEEEKWFRVWDILFPQTPRPELPYLSKPQEREAADLRRFWRKAGPSLVAGVLEKNGLLRWEDPGEEAALAALHASVLEGMMEYLRLGSDSANCSTLGADCVHSELTQA